MASGFSSVMFVPATKPERVGRALAAGPDLVCLDLEDSVPERDKASARATALAMIGERPGLMLRINGLRTQAGIADLLALCEAPQMPALVMTPMVQCATELEIVRSVLGARSPRLLPLVETVAGLRSAGEIAAADGVAAMMFGGGDFSAELGVELAWTPLLAARSAFVMACAGAGVPAIDVPFIALDDPDGLAAECRAAKALGFSAKAAIHPDQVAAINTVFKPTPAEIAEAEEAQRVFAAADGAPVRFKGRMLEAPIMRRYQRVLDSRSKENA